MSGVRRGQGPVQKVPTEGAQILTNSLKFRGIMGNEIQKEVEKAHANLNDAGAIGMIANILLVESLHKRGKGTYFK